MASRFSRFKNDVLSDPAAMGLIASNLLTIAMAVVLGWGFFEVFWVYCAQIIIILFFMFLKVLNVKDKGAEFELMSTWIDGKKQDTITTKSKWLTAISGFLVFIFVNLSFLPIFFLLMLYYPGFPKLPLVGSNRTEDFIILLPAIGAFFVSHLFSFIIYRKKISKRKLHKIWFKIAPKRIWPLYFSLFLVGSLGSYSNEQFLLVLFLLSKTVMDMWLHIKEHRNERKSRKRTKSD